MSNLPDPHMRKLVMETDAIVEAGWWILRDIRHAKDCDVSDKEYFFAGAAFLFDAMLYSFGPGKKPTEEDMEIISKLHNELLIFNNNFNLKIKIS